MVIDVEALKKNVQEFQKIIEEYENNHLQIYGEYNYSSLYWNDNFSRKFYKDLESEKLKEEKVVDTLFQLQKIYEQMMIFYEKIGNQIVFDLSNTNTLLSNLKQIIKDLDYILILYQKMVNISVPETMLLQKQKNKLRKVKTKLKRVQLSYTEILKAIRMQEKKVQKELSNISISDVKEKDVHIYFKESI